MSLVRGKNTGRVENVFLHLGAILVVALLSVSSVASAEDVNRDGWADESAKSAGEGGAKGANIAPNGTFFALEWEAFSAASFHTVDVNAGPSVVSTLLPTGMQALARHPDGRLFGGDDSGNLYTINTTTGAATLFASSVVNDIRGMAFRSDGVLFLSEIDGSSNGNLVRIDDVDTSTATTTLGLITGPGMFSDGMQGLAFQGSSLFGVTPDFNVQPGLYSISTTDGSAALIGDPGIDVYQSIVFTQSGRLFGIGSGSGAFFSEINPATGALIGSAIDVSAFDFRGLEFVSVGNLPAGSNVAIVLLAACLLIVGFLAVRLHAPARGDAFNRP